MKTLRIIPGRIKFIISVFSVNLLLFLLFRLIFILNFKPHDLTLSSKSFLWALYLGVKFDARLAALICLPFLFLSWIYGLNPVKYRLGRIAWFAYFIIAQGAVNLFYYFDFGMFKYIKTRINPSLLMFTENPEISFKMILSTYPWPLLILLFVATLTGYFFILKKLGEKLLNPAAATAMNRWKRSLIYILFGFLLIGVVYGKFQRYPLRWSDAFVHKDSFLCQFSLNPVLFYWDTSKIKARDFDPDKVKEVYPVMAEHFGAITDMENYTLKRRGNPRPQIPEDFNLVIIFLETFAAFKVGIMGNEMDSSPHFDSLAENGMLFKRFYVPMENTSRSLFAALFGIPDVSTKSTSSRNPLVVNQHTILNAFEGYEKMYFLGGSANWGNIRGMLAHNVEDLTIYEEGSYDSPVHDVWGISDEDLFIEANEVLKKKEGPFAAIIMTAGNHRPFEIPHNARNFETVDIPEEDYKPAGFYSLEEVNGFRFLDHSLGYFFKLAEQEPYFDRTLFVILGDHGTRGGSRDRRFGGLAFASIHVPLLFYSPGYVEPQKIELIMSELDLMPTLASFMGKPYINTTLGRDVFNPDNEMPHCAFAFTPFDRPPSIGLIEDHFYAILSPGGTPSLHKLSVEDQENDVKSIYPERTRRMIRLAEGYHEMAKYLLYINKREYAVLP